MKLKKGDRFKNYMGKDCFISYLRGDVVKLSYICNDPYVEVWDKKELLSEIDGFRFHPQPENKVNRNNISDHLIEYELNIVGRTVDEVKSDEKWYQNNTMTTKQHEMFKSYAIPLMKKVFKFNKKKAEQTFAWFDLMYGLKIKD